MSSQEELRSPCAAFSSYPFADSRPGGSLRAPAWTSSVKPQPHNFTFPLNRPMPKSVGFFVDRRKEVMLMPCQHFKVTICQRSKRQSSVAGLPTRAGAVSFLNTIRKRKATGTSMRLFMPRSCFRQMLLRSFLTGTHFGILLRLSKINGIRSWPEGSFSRFRSKCRRISIRK